MPQEIRAGSRPKPSLTNVMQTVLDFSHFKYKIQAQIQIIISNSNTNTSKNTRCKLQNTSLTYVTQRVLDFSHFPSLAFQISILMNTSSRGLFQNSKGKLWLDSWEFENKIAIASLLCLTEGKREFLAGCKDKEYVIVWIRATKNGLWLQ